VDAHIWKVKSRRQLLLIAGLMNLLLLVLALSFSYAQNAQTDSTTFRETGKTVRGRFLAYWNKYGGLTQYGFPISDEMQEKSDLDGVSYTVQYFERAVFEYHPEERPPYDVLLSLLGFLLYEEKYPHGAPNQVPNDTLGSVSFPQTGKRLGGKFLEYWKSHGEIIRQGYPISDELTERSDVDGRVYLVQYFERAVLEYHPEKKPPYDILLSLLGASRYKQKYGTSSVAQSVTFLSLCFPPLDMLLWTSLLLSIPIGISWIYAYRKRRLLGLPDWLQSVLAVGMRSGLRINADEGNLRDAIIVIASILASTYVILVVIRVISGVCGVFFGR
jgi:hypothetical protein